jgi:hypothetical protein
LLDLQSLQYMELVSWHFSKCVLKWPTPTVIQIRFQRTPIKMPRHVTETPTGKLQYYEKRQLLKPRDVYYPAKHNRMMATRALHSLQGSSSWSEGQPLTAGAHSLWSGNLLSNTALRTANIYFRSDMFSIDRPCVLGVRVPGYRSGGPGLDFRAVQKQSSGSGTGSTHPREYNWGATWKKK